MSIENELREIKSLLLEVNKKLDALLEEKQTVVLTENSLKDFLEEEPDIYSLKDVKRSFPH
jgi:regulator of replication initiation timing